jgi:hypothetical protein
VLDVPPAKNKVTEQISGAKTALDAARRFGDQLRIDLAEEALNNLLDRYHTYHASHRREQHGTQTGVDS